MKNALVVALFCLLPITLIAGQQPETANSPKSRMTSATGSVEAKITKLEQEWANAIATKGATAVDQYEADDIVSTDPEGRVTDKAQDKKDLSSGDLKFESLTVSDIKVHVYGSAAVATGTSTVKGTYKGRDMGGTYRFTDTWVKRNGKWQAVASQATKVQQ